LTSKGQVTIPKWIRDELGLGPGTELEFDVRRGEIRARRAQGAPGRGDRIVERMRRTTGGDLKLSTDEIMALTRGED
jgi:antitoxin PrlF